MREILLTDFEVQVEEESDVKDYSSEEEDNDDSTRMSTKESHSSYSTIRAPETAPLPESSSEKPYFNDVFCDPPLNLSGSSRVDAPTWLQSAQQLREVADRLAYETMGECVTC